MLPFLAAEKTTMYYVFYWLTALLPVILGLVITFFLVKILTKKYQGDNDEDIFDEFKEKDD